MTSSTLLLLQNYRMFSNAMFPVLYVKDGKSVISVWIEGGNRILHLRALNICFMGEGTEVLKSYMYQHPLLTHRIHLIALISYGKIT